MNLLINYCPLGSNYCPLGSNYCTLGFNYCPLGSNYCPLGYNLVYITSMMAVGVPSFCFVSEISYNTA